MLVKTIPYIDYNGNDRTEDFYFNLSETEITEMELSIEGGFTDYIQRIVKAKDAPSLIKNFKEIVLKAYGEKSQDGRRFVKSPEISEAFSQTEAFNKLFMELVMDDGAAADFINGIIPDSLREKAKEKQAALPGA